MGLGLSLRAAARALNISPAYLSKIELDQVRPPSGALLRRISHLFRVAIDEIEERAGERSRELMAADPAALAADVFYRMTRGRPMDELDRILRGLVEFINISPEQRARIRDGLPEVFEQIRRERQVEEAFLQTVHG
jgi:transcriptional regulator with XRE-family HTH domain